MPIVIDFLSNVRQLLRGTDDAEQAFEAVADSLDDAARDGEQATERLERGFKELSDVTRRETRDMRQSLDRNVVDGVGRGREAIREFRSEAIQNLGEVASSFDGSVEGIADGFQGLAGGASASLIALGGPIAGIGAALAGIGLIGGAMFTRLSEQAEAAEERVSNAFNDMIESGQNFVSEQFLTAEVQRILDDPALYESAQKIAERINVPIDTAVRALAGYGDSAATVRERVQFELDELQAAIARGGRGAEQQLGGQVGALQGINRQLSETADGYNTAATKAQIFRDATAESREETQQLGDALGTLPTDVTVKVTPELPDAASVVAQLEQSFKGRRVRVDATLVTPYGQEIR